MLLQIFRIIATLIYQYNSTCLVDQPGQESS